VSIAAAGVSKSSGNELPRKTTLEKIALTHEQVRRLPEAAGELATMVYVLAYSGLRYSECGRRRWVMRTGNDVEIAASAHLVVGRMGDTRQAAVVGVWGGFAPTMTRGVAPDDS
jgi:hypothetical protein